MIYAIFGTYTNGRREGLFVYRYDATTGAFEPVGSAETLANPTFLTVHPSKRFVYAVAEIGDYDGKKQGAASAYAFDTDSGALTLINHVASPGAGPCHIVLDPANGSVVLSNYGDGSVAVLPVGADGALGAATGFVQHTGKGSTQRQDGPHAHSTTFSPDGRVAYVADLGLDKVMAYRLEGGTLAAHDIPFLSVQSGAGPRHFDFHPNGEVGYLINELDNTIVVVDYDAATGELRPKQTISTLPEDFDETSYCADIHVHPSGQFVYGSNRGHNSIAVFNVGSTGLLTPSGHVSTGGRWPRNFAIDPAGAFLHVANEQTDDVFSFRIDQQSGELTPVGSPLSIAKPVCIKFVEA